MTGAHRVVFDFTSGEGPTLTFECNAGEGARCRMMPACMVAGDCEEYHASSCTWKEQTLVDAGFCNAREWINGAGAEIESEAKFALDVSATWNGDCYEWAPTGLGGVLEVQA